MYLKIEYNTNYIFFKMNKKYEDPDNNDSQKISKKEKYHVL